MSRRGLVRHVVLVVGLLALLVVPAQAPRTAGGTAAAAPAPKAGRTASRNADFNGDGFADLAIGVPFEDIGSIVDAGAVQVLYGSPGGLMAAGNQFWTQDSPGIVDTAESYDFFSSALTAGDFNGDGFTDLAVGVHREDIGSPSLLDAGAVQVLYGSSTGPAAAGNQFWSQDSTGMRGAAEGQDLFGSALAAGDFNGDGAADLATGVFGENVKDIADAGEVDVLYGSAAGLDAANNQVWSQYPPTVKDIAEVSDQFEFSLVSR